MIQALIPVLAPILGKVVGNLFPDPEQKAKAESEMMRQLLASWQKPPKLRVRWANALASPRR